MKAVLVIDDMPISCDKCEVRCDGYTAKEYAEKSIKKPSWCPLKPLPIKKEALMGMGKINFGKALGWNDCLEEIENG